MVDQASIDILTLQLYDGGWDDWTGTVSSIRIQRGGGVTVDVGTMTVVLMRSDDPLADETITAGQAIRVVQHGTSSPIFTGVVQDADVGIVRDGGGGVRNAVTVVAVDAVASHAKNTRYGAVTDGDVGHETFVERLTRLATSSATTVSLPSEPVSPLPWECQDVAFTSSLASHFDLACQTVGANWYVDSGNVTRFRLPDDATSSAGIFSDQLDDPNQYDDVVIDSGSKQVVNTLKITNHGRGNDGNTFDISTTFEDSASVAEWGARSASTDMCVWDAEMLLSGRAEEVFDAYADPVREVDQVIWDGQQNPTLATALDIQLPVTVLFGAETFDTRIVALGHDIGPSWWTITIATSTRGVPESQAVNDAYSSTSATGAVPVDRDARAPQAPEGVDADPFAAWQGGEMVLAIQASWDEVTLGDNGAPIEVAQYEVWARPDDGATPSQAAGSTIGLTLSITDLAFAVGDDWLVKVRAQSEGLVWSPFSDEASVTLVEPTETLDEPQAPIVTSARGIVLITTNGLFGTAPPEPAPAWFREFRIERSSDVSGPYTAIGVLNRDVDARAFNDMAVGDDWWFQLVPVDKLGRDGITSDPTLVTVSGIDGADIIAGTITAQSIQVGTLTVDLVEPGFGNALEIDGNVTIAALSSDVSAVGDSVTAVEGDVATVAADVATMGTYFDFASDGLGISAPGSDYSQRISATRTEFLQGAQVISYLEAGQFVAPLLVATSAKIGNHQWSKAASDAGSVVRALL